MTPSENYILQVNGLSKAFSGVKALQNVRLNIRRGEVHALMGENGAGKSTFMKVLIGLLTPDTGELIVDGQPLIAGSVKASMAMGIAMIHQEVLNVPELTVAQNIFLGRETKGGLWRWLDDGRLNKQAGELLAQLGVDIPANTKMKLLSVAQRQMVEIAKAISNEARVIIMDEPTSALTEREVTTLFRIIRELTQKGVAIIYISHKLEEIFAIADTITVLRDGQYIATKPAPEFDTDSLITLMVGRKIDSLFPPSSVTKGNEVLSVKHLTRNGKFSDISFTVHQGEVLGIAGLMGAGRTELARVLFGLDRSDEGEVFVKGKQVTIHTPQDAIRHGIGYVSEDRKGWGFVPGLSVKENITLSSLPAYKQGPFIQRGAELEAATTLMADLNIKASNGSGTSAAATSKK
jgi:inositol transport system ATP-binding protein